MFRFLGLLAAASLCGNPFDLYLDKEYPGDAQKGEIEIVREIDRIGAIEEMLYRGYLKKGLDEQTAKEWARTGIVAEDAYWIWQRDPVEFPSGALGAYGRIIWKSQLTGPVGVAVLPILPNGKIALNLNFRHATRSWELELPRGARNQQERPEETALRELKEETGYSAYRLEFLGEMAADTGVLGGIAPVFAGWVGERGEAASEDSEAIAAIHSFTFEELEEGLRKGFLQIEPQGKVPLRDSFLTFALFQFKNRGLK